MMFPSNRLRVVIATKPVDFRKGHDGLAALIKNELRKDPFTHCRQVNAMHSQRGGPFLCSARSGQIRCLTAHVYMCEKGMKLLYWDGTGLVMAYKRLEEHTFIWPAIKDGLLALNHAQFEALFSGLDWRKVRALSVRPPTAAE